MNLFFSARFNGLMLFARVANTHADRVPETQLHYTKVINIFFAKFQSQFDSLYLSLS